MMNHIFSDMLDVRIKAYLDNILVYAKTQKLHDHPFRDVLNRLKMNGLAVLPEKCVWRTRSIFLGYIIGRDGIRMFFREKKSPFQQRPALDVLRVLGKILDSNLVLIGSWHASNSQ